MKWVALIIFPFLFCKQAISQKKNFDILSYTQPAGWKEEKGATNISYSKKENKNWAQIIIYQHSVSLGEVQKDFEKEWQELVTTPYKLSNPIERSAPFTEDGWTIISGTALWQFNGTNVAVILTTCSNKKVCVSVLCNATAEPYIEVYKQLLASLEPQKTTKQHLISPSPGIKTTFKFNETTFDDGWTSSIQNDWVEVTKGKIKVLIHYPKEGTVISGNDEAMTNAAWNILVAPRYSNLKNYKFSCINDFQRPYFGTGYGTELQTGQSSFIVLFRRGGGWLEVISPDQKSFIQEFGFNPESIRWGQIAEYLGGYIADNSLGKTVKVESELFDKLDRMTNYNRFAVAASDLNNAGRWDANYSSNSFYYNAYSGAYAGMSTYSSAEWFVFGKDQTYTWKIAAVNSGAGGSQVATGEGKGSFKSLNNWQLAFTNISGKPKTFDVYFSATKDGRVLFMNDAKFPGSGIFTGFAKKK